MHGSLGSRPGNPRVYHLHARADELWREARKLARKSKEGWESARAYQLCALRRRDPSAFYRTHENMADVVQSEPPPALDRDPHPVSGGYGPGE